MDNGFGQGIGNHQQAVLDGGISDQREVTIGGVTDQSEQEIGGYTDSYNGHPVLGGGFTDV